MENLMDEPGFVVEKITGEFVLADEVHLLECELEVYGADKRNDHIYAFLMMNLLYQTYDREDKQCVILPSPTNQVS